MKTLLTFLCLALGFADMPAFASNTNLICEQDKRPADGAYTKLEVKFLSNDRANVYLSQISGGFGPPGSGGDNFTNKVIGRNLICQLSRSQNVTLDCYSESSRFPVISIGPKRIYDSEFIEVLNNGKSLALFDSSACEPKF